MENVLLRVGPRLKLNVDWPGKIEIPILGRIGDEPLGRLVFTADHPDGWPWSSQQVVQVRLHVAASTRFGGTGVLVSEGPIGYAVSKPSFRGQGRRRIAITKESVDLVRRLGLEWISTITTNKLALLSAHANEVRDYDERFGVALCDIHVLATRLMMTLNAFVLPPRFRRAFGDELGWFGEEPTELWGV